jgi:hypothetical protein
VSAGTASSLRSGASDVWVERLARFGLVGKGAVHLVVGLLALEVALGGPSSEEASTAGAAQWIADRPFGLAALWVMAASLTALALWRGITTFTGDPVEDDDGWYRGVWAAKAAAYATFAVAFASLALRGGRGGGGTSDDERASETAATVFDWPFGRWLVIGAGLVVIGVALYLVVVHAVGAQFARRLRTDERSTAVKLGRAGYGLRSVAYVLVGWFLIDAGLAGEEQRAEGISGALDRASEAAWGTTLLLGAASGFLAYGVYCLAEAALRRDA